MLYPKMAFRQASKGKPGTGNVMGIGIGTTKLKMAYSQAGGGAHYSSSSSSSS